MVINMLHMIFEINIILHLVDLPDKLLYKSFDIQYSPLFIPSDSELPIYDQEKLKAKNEKQFSNLLEMKIELSNKIFWWEQPIVCHWKTWEESSEFKSLEPAVQEFNLNYNEILRTKSKRLFNTAIRKTIGGNTVEILDDFNLLSIPDEIKLYQIITKHIMPRLTTTYRFQCEIQDEQDKLADELKRRERMFLEHEEDIKMASENKNHSAAEFIQNLIIKTLEKEHLIDMIEGIESKSSEKEPEQIKMPKDASIADLTFKFKKLVQSTAARELFLHLEKYPTLEIRTQVMDTGRSSLPKNSTEQFLLTELLDQIQKYNLTETPIFKTETIISLEKKSKVAKATKIKPKKAHKHEDKINYSQFYSKSKEKNGNNFVNNFY